MLEFGWAWNVALKHIWIWFGLAYAETHCAWIACKPPQSSSCLAWRTVAGLCSVRQSIGHNFGFDLNTMQKRSMVSSFEYAWRSNISSQLRRHSTGFTRCRAPPDRSFQLKRWDEQGLCPFISPIDDVKKKEIYQPLNHDSEGDCPNMFTLLNVGRPYPVRRYLDSASYGLGPATPTFYGWYLHFKLTMVMRIMLELRSRSRIILVLVLVFQNLEWCLGLGKIYPKRSPNF